MSEIQVIENAVTQTARRRRLQRAWAGFWLGLFAGACLWLTALALYKLAPLPEWILPAAGAVAIALWPIGFFIGLGRRTSLAETARWVDNQQHFQERLSTALEVSRSEKSGRWRDLVLTDAAAHARRFDLRKALPFQLPAVTRWSLLILVLGATLGFVPEYRSQDHLRKKKEAEVIRETGRQLAALTQRSLERRAPALEPTEKGLGAVKELGEQMAKLQLNRTEALRDLASITEKLKDQTKELGKNPGVRKLEQAARSQTGQSPSSAAELQKQIDSMQKQLGNPSADANALEKLQKELQKMQQAAAGMSANDSSGAQQQKEQMSQSLSDLAKKADELGLSLPSLDEAIKALEAGQIDQLLKDLKFTENDLEKMQAMAKALQQLEKQLAQLGKDLAEQLEKGQASLAQSTLQKMIEDLKSAQLTPEQLSKMLAEVDKAVKPGSQYGKVGEFLKDSVQKLQQGEKAGAAKSLADASDELKRLMDQVGDGESLMATLDALQKAQMCVGNAMSWGQCQSIGFNPKGGKPGRGVGSWSDDNGWSTDFVEMTDRWDNSGVNRPDMDPRGLTDRDASLSDALVPTKVKGQISPGGPMPSITLKGVSIKGTSKVAYQEAVTAAQDSAQSALSQEQVPRAYQGAVRDYFDDLKE